MLDFSESWFSLAIISTFLFGIHSFLYKKIAEDNVDLLSVQITFPAVVALMVLPIIWYQSVRLAEDYRVLIGVAAIQGVLFFMTTETRLLALKAKLPVHILFPIIKFGTVIIVVLSASFYKEWETLSEPKRLLGVFLALLATLTLIQFKAASHWKTDGLKFALFSMIASVGAALAAKYIFLEDSEANIFGFILISNCTNMVLATVLGVWRSRYGRGKVQRAMVNKGLKWGVVIGLLNFAGFTAFMLAIKHGDLSLVASINTLYIFIPVLLASWLYGEKLTLVKQVAVVVSIIAVILIK